MPSLGEIRRDLVIAVALVLVYVAVWGFEYSTDLLGRSPVLDAQENLGWVESIREQQLPAEPLYRALLYPSLLSLLPFSVTSLPQVALVFGLGCHVLSAFLVYRLARHVWKSQPAGWGGALVYAVYPVALYFSVQVLDVTFATTLFLAALVCLLCPKKPSAAWQLLGGICIGLAVLARPNFLLVALVLPIVAMILSQARGRLSWTAPFYVGLPICLLLLGQGLISQRISGDFRILPWQGSYNLYAANKTGANGRYFVQQFSFEKLPVGVNPTRKESEVLYQQAVGEDASLEIDAMSAHWRAALCDDVLDNPFRWLGLMGRKVIYLFNDWEQYNNLSYAYQKERFSLLRYNPLGWGVLVLIACLALVYGSGKCDCWGLAMLGLIGLTYAAGVLLFFVSARFRLPLAPLLCVAAAGVVYLRPLIEPKRVLLTVGLLLPLGLLVYGNWFGARDRGTFIQDQALLAISASHQADDDQALKFSGLVLEQQAQRQDMRRIEVTSYFNLWLETAGVEDRAELWRELGHSLSMLSDHDAATYFVAGIYDWRNGTEEAGIAFWRAGITEYPAESSNSAAALLAVGESAPVQPRRLVQQVRALIAVE